MFCNKEILIKNISNKGNKILIWGACERNNEILEFFANENVNVAGYIDSSAEKESGGTYNGLSVYSKDIIKENKFFVFVGLLNTYNDILEFFAENDYKEFVDYWYPERKVVLDGSKPYKDLYGNEYVGENYSLKIVLSANSKLYIGKDGKFEDAEISVLRKSKLEIKENCEITKANLQVLDESKCYIGCKFNTKELYLSVSVNSTMKIHNMVSIYSGNLSSQYDSTVIIQDNLTACLEFCLATYQNSTIHIGKDCMFSSYITMLAGNAHNIFDLENSLNLSQKSNKVIIGNHVWLGVRACLFNGCDIGDGSIVGINTSVNKKFPKNCSIAGNPARIIKENVAWRREPVPYFSTYDDFKEFDFR